MCLYWGWASTSPAIHHWFQSDGIVMLEAAARLKRGEISVAQYPFLGVKHFALYFYFIESWNHFGEDPVPLGWLTVVYTCLFLIVVYRAAAISGAGPLLGLAAPLFIVTRAKLVTWDIWWNAAGLHFIPAAFWGLVGLQLCGCALKRCTGRGRVALLLGAAAACWMLALMHNVQVVFLAVIPFALGIASSRLARRRWRTALPWWVVSAAAVAVFAFFYFSTELLFPDQAGYRNPFEVRSLSEFAGSLSQYYGQGHALDAQRIAALGLVALAVVALLRRRAPYRWAVLLAALLVASAGEFSWKVAADSTSQGWPRTIPLAGGDWPTPFIALFALTVVALLLVPIQPLKIGRYYGAMILALLPVQIVSLYFNRGSMWERYNLYCILLQGVCAGGGLNAVVAASTLALRRALRRGAARAPARVAGRVGAVVIVLAIAAWPGALQWKSQQRAIAYYQSFSKYMESRTRAPYEVASRIADWVRERSARSGSATLILASSEYWNAPRPQTSLLFVLTNLFSMRGLSEYARIDARPSLGPEGGELPAGALLALDPVQALAASILIPTDPAWSYRSEFANVSLLEAHRAIPMAGAVIVTPQSYLSYGVAIPAGKIRSGFFRMDGADDVLEIPFAKVRPGAYEMVILAQGSKAAHPEATLVVTDRRDQSLYQDAAVPDRAVLLRYPIVVSSGEEGVRLRMRTATGARVTPETPASLSIALVVFVPAGAR